MEILSIDIPTRSFEKLKITNIHRDSVTCSGGLVALDYEGANGEKSMFPIHLNDFEFTLLQKGNVVELHKGEIAIVLLQDFENK